MTGSLYLAWRYVAHHRIKTSILVLSITLIVYVPIGLRMLVAESAAQLTARAEATPLLIGARGSPLELALNSLYFESKTPVPLLQAEVTRIAESGLALPIPLHVRFQAQQRPIVGTTLEYFGLRELRVAAGRQMTGLGECVVGARVAEAAGLTPGDTVVSSPENVFDLAGVYPLEMTVVGILAPTHSPDDEAIFVDLKTAWIIEGLGHGHEDLARPEASGSVLEREGDRITANAAVEQYRRIDPDTAASFHFHGGAEDFPITAVIAVPHDAKASAILQGRYQADGAVSQVVRPNEVIEDLLATVFTVQGYIVAAVVFVGSSTVLTTVLVFLLSSRLRRREIETMTNIGGSRAGIASILALEVVFVVVLSLLLAGGLTLATARYGAELLRSVILS